MTRAPPPVDDPGQVRKWWVMASVGFGVFLSTVDGSIVNVALPTLEHELHTELAIVQWVLLAYLLTLTALIVGVGRLADMYGRKRIYVAGFVAFTTGSVMSGLAPSIHALLASRVFQAIGAAMILPLGTAIVTAVFPPRQRGMALGVSGAVVSFGIIVGPTLGGLIVGTLSWRWIFFVNLPVGIVGTLMALRFVPSDRPIGGQRFDLLGAAIFVFALLALLAGLTAMQSRGPADPIVLAAVGVSVLAWLVFVATEHHVPQPMVELSLFRDAMLAISLVTGFIAFVAVSGTTLLVPFYLQGVLAYDPRQVGLLMAVVPLGLGFVAPVSGMLSDHLGTERIAAVGMGILVLAYAGMTTLGTATTAAGFAVRYLPIGIGMGMFQSPNNSAVMGSAPHGRLGVVSGRLAITRPLGQTTGVAVLTTLWSLHVLAQPGGASAPDPTLAPAAAQAAALDQTFVAVSGLIAVAFGLSLWRAAMGRRRLPARR